MCKFKRGMSSRPDKHAADTKPGGLTESPGEAGLSRPGKGTYSIVSRGKGQGGLSCRQIHTRFSLMILTQSPGLAHLCCTMIGMHLQLTLPCSASLYSALAFQSKQPCLEMKPFVKNARSPFLADENQTCPLTCSQGPKDSTPGHSRLLVASNCFLSQRKGKKKYHLELI